jgi:hypothetical protein
MDAFSRFAARLGDTVGLDLSGAEPGTALADAGFDSLAMAETLILLASDGIDLPLDLVTQLQTLGDVHHYATVLAPAGASR